MCAFQACDGFDNYNSAALYYEYVVGTITYSSSYARLAPPAGCPGQGVLINQSAYVRKNLQSNQGTLIIKLAVRIPSLGVNSSGGALIMAWDNGTPQCTLAVLPSGALCILQAATGSIIAQTSPGILSAGAWAGIEWEISISTSTGISNIWVNGAQVMTASGLATQQSANAYANQVSFGDMTNRLNTSIYADDFRVWDTTGSYQNAPVGIDSRIITKLPSGAGSVTAWTPNGASQNWQCVDENPPDGDTTYVSASTAGNQDSYAMPVASFTIAPVMVLARALMRKDDSATRTAGVGVVRGFSGATGITATIGSSYAFVDGCISIDPSTGLVWTASGADAALHLKTEVS